MRRVVHAELYAESDELPKLMTDWSSCVRFAYNRFRDGLGFDAVRVRAKGKYPALNTRHVSDAVMEAKGRHERTKGQGPIVFGGKGLFAKVSSGEVSADEWRFLRDGMMYTRGDRTKFGNPNFRVVRSGGEYRLRVTVGNRDFRLFSLFVPDKFRGQVEDLLTSGIAYNVRLCRKDGSKYRVIIDYEVKTPGVSATRRNGIIGVDTNPDRISISFAAPDGNRVWSKTLVNTRIFYGSANRTLCDIALLVKEITNLALENGCAIACENLKFERKFVNGWRKSNRMKSRSPWRSFLRLLERKCQEKGIEFRKVNSAFTSIEGELKYRRMFNIPVHEAAAYVIGRRALGFNEKLSVYRWPHGVARRLVVQTLQEAGDGPRRYHSWYLWRRLGDIAFPTGSRSSLCNPGELHGNASDERSGGGNPPGESFAITGRRRGNDTARLDGKLNGTLLRLRKGSLDNLMIS